jgi:hypothetical protein
MRTAFGQYVMSCYGKGEGDLDLGSCQTSAATGRVVEQLNFNSKLEVVVLGRVKC